MADDDTYDVTVAQFDDVTEFEASSVRGEGTSYLRLHDEAANTLLYVTTEGRGDSESVTLAVRDATDLQG
jgi:hypothetical protein